MGRSDEPRPTNFQTILRSVGITKHRPIFTTTDITTRSFRIDVNAFIARTDQVITHIQNLELDKLTQEYRVVAFHYVKATRDRAYLILRSAQNGLFFLLKHFWMQVQVPNPLPHMDLSDLIPKKSKQKYYPNRYQLGIDYINTFQSINTSVLTYVRSTYETGQFDKLNPNVKASITQVLGTNKCVLDLICMQENITMPKNLEILIDQDLHYRYAQTVIENIFNLSENSSAENCLTGLLLYLQKSEQDLRLVFGIPLVSSPKKEHVIRWVNHKNEPTLKNWFPDMSRRSPRSLWNLFGLASTEDVTSNRVDILTLQNGLNSIAMHEKNITGTYNSFKRIAESEITAVTDLEAKVSAMYNATASQIKNWDKNRAAIKSSFSVTSAILELETTLQILNTELDIIDTAFQHDYGTVYNLLQLHRFESPYDEDWSSNTLINMPSLFLSEKEFVVKFATSYANNKFHEFSIRALPIKLGDRYFKLDLPDTLFTDKEYKISKDDINTCSSTSAHISCGPLIVFEKLSPCEKALFDPSFDNATISACLKNINIIQNPKEEFVYTKSGVIYFNPNDTVIKSKCGFKYKDIKVKSGISFHNLPHTCSLTTERYVIQGHLSSILKVED